MLLAMSINEQLDELFSVWRKNRACSEGIFIPDGHVNEEEWTNSGLKLMVLLKEANSTQGGWDYQEFIRDRGYLREKSTWPTLIRWTYGILHNFPEFMEVEERYAEIREEADYFFRRVYFANAKKIAGGSSASHQSIESHMNETHPLILKQMKILKPNLVLCCGDVVFQGIRSSLEKDNGASYKLKRSSGGLEYLWWEDIRTSIIRYHHPNAFYPRHMSYSYLMREIQSIL